MNNEIRTAMAFPGDLMCGAKGADDLFAILAQRPGPMPPMFAATNDDRCTCRGKDPRGFGPDPACPIDGDVDLIGDDMTTQTDVPIPPEIRQQWRDEADEKITVENQGSRCVVLVEGHIVAEFTTFGGLISDKARWKDTTIVGYEEAANEYAADLRLAYECLASGDDFEFERAQRRFQEATGAVCRGAERAAGRLVRKHFPTATQIVVDGEYNEDGLMRVRLNSILDADDNVLYAADEPTVEFEEVCDELDGDIFTWLEAENDDWDGVHIIDIDP